MQPNNHLPSLIKETIDWYRWKVNLKNLNNEYYTKAQIQESHCVTNITCLRWVETNRCIISIYENPASWCSSSRVYISSFTKDDKPYHEIPKYYNYTSGCDDCKRYIIKTLSTTIFQNTTTILPDVTIQRDIHGSQ